VSVRVRINPVACEAHGVCAELLPELIRLDDWGYPILATSEVTDTIARFARMAERACPTLAIMIDDV
jgi:ferredoxin